MLRRAVEEAAVELAVSPLSGTSVTLERNSHDVDMCCRISGPRLLLAVRTFVAEIEFWHRTAAVEADVGT